jgi:hypothetical protein
MLMTKRDCLQCLVTLMAVVGSLAIAIVVAAVHIGAVQF